MTLIEKLTKALNAPNLDAEAVRVKVGESVTAKCNSILMPVEGMALIDVQMECHFELISELFGIAKELAAELDAPKEVKAEWENMLNKLEMASKGFAAVKADIAKYTG